MLTIDGSTGGGQVLRTALTLSALTERAIRIEHVRGARDNPGLRPQHLAGINVLTTLTDAKVEGGAVGSETVTFEPTSTPGGTVEIDIGTAGSIPLLFETVVACSPVLEAAISVRAIGGTDVKWAPTIDYLEHVKLAALADHGFDVDLEIGRRGYYPVGGGVAEVTVHPSTVTPFDLTRNAHLDGVLVFSRATESLRSAEVAQRQVEGASSLLEEASVPIESVTTTYHDVPSTGTSVTVVGRFADGYAGGDAIGERGKPAETVGGEAADALLTAVAGPGAVDRHLSDQLMVPLVLAGGQLVAPSSTDHLTSNAHVIRAFDVEIELTERADGSVLIESPGLSA